MANLCGFELHVRANVANEDSLLEMKKRFWFDENGFSKSFGQNDIGTDLENRFSVTAAHLDEYKLINGYYVMQIWGECKWAVNGPLLDELNEFMQTHQLDAELYSEEDGVGFEEHYKWEKGILVIDKCCDLVEFHIDDIMDDEDGELNYLFNKDACVKAACTKDNYQSFADDDGYIRLGGFGDWDFEF